MTDVIYLGILREVSESLDRDRFIMMFGAEKGTEYYICFRNTNFDLLRFAQMLVRDTYTDYLTLCEFITQNYNIQSSGE